MAARRGKIGDQTTRDALLDAAGRVLLADGYAAATTRRVAGEAGVNSALISYYFDSLDGMFVALFRRGAERSFERLRAALDSDQPLWGFWDLIHDRSNSDMTMEFIALAKRREVLRREIAEYSRRFRRTQIDALTGVLDGYGIDEERWPASVVVLILSSISRFLLIEEAFDVDIGHAETEALIEEFIRDLEGERRDHDAALAAKRSAGVAAQASCDKTRPAHPLTRTDPRGTTDG